MLYTEFYVVPTSVDPTASILNGGSGGTPLIFNNCSLGSGVVTGTTGLVVGDWITWDTAGTKNRCIVTGASPVIISPTDGSSLPTTAIMKTLIARGNWADPSTVTGLTTASVNAAGNPPRLNIYEPATYTVGMTAGTFTAAIPLTVEGYAATPGDLRGTMTAPLIQPASGTVVSINGGHITFRNIRVSVTNSARGFFVNGGTEVNFINCTGGGVTPEDVFYYFTAFGGLMDTCLVTSGGDAYHAAVNLNNCYGITITGLRVTGLNAGALSAIALPYTQGVTVVNSYFVGFTGDCVSLNNASSYVALLSNTAHNIVGNFVDGSTAELGGLIIENSIFCNLTGSGNGLVVKSTAGSRVCLARYAHNLEYNIGGRFSANILDNSEDIVTGSNPFANGNEIPTGGALSHQELMADGVLYTYPDLGAMQTLSTNPGVGNVKGPPSAVTYYFGGVLYTGTGANISGRGGFIFGD